MSKKNIFPIDASQILFFARSINEENPIYYDAEYAKSKGLRGTIAPLTFVEAYHQFDSTYRLRPNPDKKWPGTPRQKITESKKNDFLMKKPSLQDLLHIEHPVIMAPMFLVSNVAMSIAGMQQGIATCIPALNYRSLEELREACKALKKAKTSNGAFGFNLIVNKSNPKSWRQKI